MSEQTKELLFLRPTRFYFYYNKSRTPQTMRFVVGEAYFDCKALELKCPTKVVFNETAPHAVVEGWTTRIEILLEDNYIIHS